MRLKFTRRNRGSFSGGLLLVLPVCCRDRTERVLAVRASTLMLNQSARAFLIATLENAREQTI
ncbi:plasmid mobilization protein [Salmonella enterica subsp. enterica serovar Bredeney]|nr:plasmid mobilization protein [Salmonella enterica subsp. enterica serovar Bredeney]